MRHHLVLVILGLALVLPGRSAFAAQLTRDSSEQLAAPRATYLALARRGFVARGPRGRILEDVG
jgi:hypothetical protein